MFNCNLCDREFKSKKSLTCHRNHHNPEYHIKTLKGSAALKTKKAEQTRKQNRENKKFLKWSSKNYHCITCNTKLIYPQVKTCSEECYKIYRSKANSRIMTDERRNSIKLGMERYNKTLPKKQYFCKICNNVLLKKATYCSDKCKSISKKIESEKMSKALKLAFIEGRHKGNEYRNRKNKSFLERSFIDYLNEYYPTLNYAFNKTIKIVDERKQDIRTRSQFYKRNWEHKCQKVAGLRR